MNRLPVEKIRLTPSEATTSPSPAVVVEVPVLLESRLLMVLEASAFEQGMTTAELVRRLVRDFLIKSSTPGREESRAAIV